MGKKEKVRMVMALWLEREPEEFDRICDLLEFDPGAVHDIMRNAEADILELNE